jgi:hypothetical protein
MPILRVQIARGTLLPEAPVFTVKGAVENLGDPGTPSGVEHYVGRAGPDPGYVNLPPSTVGIGGPLILPKKTDPLATRALLRLPGTVARP